MIREGQVGGIAHFECRKAQVRLDIDLEKRKENYLQREDVVSLTHFRSTNRSEWKSSSTCKRRQKMMLSETRRSRTWHSLSIKEQVRLESIVDLKKIRSQGWHLLSADEQVRVRSVVDLKKKREKNDESRRRSRRCYSHSVEEHMWIRSIVDLKEKIENDAEWERWSRECYWLSVYEQVQVRSVVN